MGLINDPLTFKSVSGKKLNHRPQTHSSQNSLKGGKPAKALKPSHWVTALVTATRVILTSHASFFYFKLK